MQLTELQRACSDANLTLAIGRQLWKLLVEVWGSITECLGWEGWGCRGSLSSSSRLLNKPTGNHAVAADKGDKWEPEVSSWHSCHVTRAVGIATTCLSSFLWGTTRTRSGNRFPQHSQHMLWLWGTHPRAERTQLSLCNVAHFRFAVHEQQIPP